MQKVLEFLFFTAKPDTFAFFSPPLARDVFPQGLPDEYAFVTTFKFRKASRKEDWYIWQIIDKYGIPQVRGPSQPARTALILFCCMDQLSCRKLPLLFPCGLGKIPLLVFKLILLKILYL